MNTTIEITNGNIYTPITYIWTYILLSCVLVLGILGECLRLLVTLWLTTNNIGK